jgi:hypothetical protein
MSRRKDLESLRAQVALLRARRDLTVYRDDPVGYAHHVLGARPWQAQIDIANLLLRPPYRVLVRSSNSVGKTWMSAWLISWFYDTRPRDCAVLTTAPSDASVKQVLWREVRMQRRRAGLGGFAGPEAPLLRDAPDHIAVGYTAAKVESFHGRHPENLLLVMDEATGVEAPFWAAAKSMFSAGGKHHWLAIYNPTNTSSQAYIEENARDPDGNPLWHVYTISAMDHPNVHAGLRGEPEPYPGAVGLAQLHDWIASFCEPVREDDDLSSGAEPFRFPPEGFEKEGEVPRLWRPGPEMEVRALGRWPSAGATSVWNETLWRRILSPLPAAHQYDLSTLPELGVDLAAGGGDYTAIHTRWGGVALAHERHNGWLPDRTAGRVKELCILLAARVNSLRDPKAEPVQPEQVPVKFDASGSMGGFESHMRGWRVLPVFASGVAARGDRYCNRRSELWFVTVEMARAGKLNLSLLPRDIMDLLRKQAFAPTWELDHSGRRQVERKEQTRRRLGGASPDDLDALNLAFLEAPKTEVPSSMDIEVPSTRERLHERIGPRHRI